ncbi:primosomal protein N' [Alteromonas sp. ASW11-36]|uniref:Replication restart protein PriA n=1 Tax=Alteromonas arenosi TaxID=3055817 RepID=A0ABT7SZ85_9ALTE|nr:primosomal protein N' [Alteromonas sp. ASW11-36]MDM7861319.1 primosomal protein N' [Alteromonas sp. ASW11-36]
MSVISVALPVPMRRTFDYLATEISPGCRVAVEFGRRQLVGVVMANKAASDYPIEKLKPIHTQLDNKPVLTTTMLELAKWLADYQHHAIGDVVQTLLPAALRKANPLQQATLDYYELTELGETQLAEPMRAKQQQALLSMLSNGQQLHSEVRQSFSAAVIRTCEAKSWINTISQPVKPDLKWWHKLAVATKPTPNAEQALAIAAINAKDKQFAPFLIEGVTGSGKTEVYLQVIEPVLQQGRQVLVLVPEIGLTPQTVARFERRFGIAIGVLHSGLNDNERLAVWQQAREGSIGLVIGTRSAVFTPFADLGMIIVDEEHDESYKQQDGMRYHARDVAVLRAQRCQCALVLGSATPSLESLNNALVHKYQLLQLHRRTGSAELASQNVLDMRGQQLQAGIAHPLLEKMHTHLSAGGQVMVFVNRRGYAPALVCHQCGHVEQCQRCDIPYTVHKKLAKLQCHRCDDVQAIPTTCNQCGSRDLMSQGVGTEQLEQFFNQAFLKHSCVRIDSDSVRGKDKLAKLIDAINQNQHQILIGTQILSKGHHFPLVSLVVVLDVDGALFSPDLRATEKLAQLLTQVSGRAGRENRNGEMWLQTHYPDHPLLQDLINNGYAHFARQALAERRAAVAPPFAHQTVFRAEANDIALVERFLSDVRDVLARQSSLTLMGPVPAIMFKRAGRFRMLLIVQAAARPLVHKSIASQLSFIESMPSANKVRWAIDVAPTDLS